MLSVVHVKFVSVEMKGIIKCWVKEHYFHDGYCCTWLWVCCLLFIALRTSTCDAFLVGSKSSGCICRWPRERDINNNNKVDHFRSWEHEYVGWHCLPFYIYDLRHKSHTHKHIKWSNLTVSNESHFMYDKTCALMYVTSTILLLLSSSSSSSYSFIAPKLLLR